jgi:beta-fructofuranosidase
MVGHAVSDDLKSWTVVRDALAISDSPAFDSYTTWTGSVVQDDNGLWWMFYTGTSREDGGNVQAIGAATSKDLLVWEKLEQNPLVRPDSTWYELLGDDETDAEHCRDPWVFRFPNQDQWHMLFTARAKTGSFRQRGVIGHAVSDDLVRWQVTEPLSVPNCGFHELEVLQFELVDGVPLVIFSCYWTNISDERLNQVGKQGLTYSVVVDENLNSVDISAARPFTHAPLYASRLVQDRKGAWFLVGFVDYVDGQFGGYLPDPVPVSADPVLGLIPKLN